MPADSIVIAEDVKRKIKDQYEKGATLKQLSEEFGYSSPIISRTIVNMGGRIRPRGRRSGNRKAALESLLTKKLNIFAKMVSEMRGSKTPEYPNDDTIKCVVDYAIRNNDGRTFRKIDRRYNYNGVFSQFRRDHLEGSYYVMGRLWRAVYRAVLLESEGKGKVKAFDFGVTPKDVDLCLSFLTEDDRTRIINWLRDNPDYVYLPNEAGIQRVVSSCEKTMKSIVASKLRFIYKYDPAYEAEDLVNYLRIVAYRVAAKYDWEKIDGSFAYTKCLNYTKKSLWNAAFLLIKENTGESYSRLARIGSDEREYQITTVSINSGMGDDDWIALEQTLGEEADTSVELRDLVEGVADESLLQYLRLEHEDVPEFTEFVFKETGQDENDLYAENYSKWRELAQKFSGLSKCDSQIYRDKIVQELGIRA